MIREKLETLKEVGLGYIKIGKEPQHFLVVKHKELNYQKSYLNEELVKRYTY